MHRISRVSPPRLACCLVLVLALGGPALHAQDFPVVVTDARGVAVAVNSAPARVVSLSPSLTEILFAVGAGPTVKGVTSYCNYPEEAKTREKIGGFSARTISVEAIVGLEPDLVFADLTRHQAVIESLRGHGLKVIATNATSLDDVFKVIELVGRATGNPGRAESLVRGMRLRMDRVTSITSSISDAEKPRVFWEVFDEPLMTAGPSTFIGQLVEAAGGINIFGDVTESWPQISHEELLNRDPQVLMSSDNHGEKFTAEQVAARPGWTEVTAVKEGRIHLFDGDMVSRPGPRIVNVLEDMARTLHPELFR